MGKNSLRVAVIAAFVLCYAGVIWSLVETWATSYAYSYGFVVFLIAGYLVWCRSSLLRVARRTPDYQWGVPIVLAGMGLLAAGRLGLLVSVQQASLVVTLAGCVLLFLGREVFAAVWFPLAYLMLGIPIWDRVIAALQPPSQLLSARLASGVLQAIDIPVLREGTDLVLPNATLAVLKECSGVNQLLAIVTMALPAAYLTLRSVGRRTSLVAFAIVTAYLSNGIRIALTGFLAYRGLSDGNLRAVHLYEGLAVSLLGYLFLFGGLLVLARGERRAALEDAPGLEQRTASVFTTSKSRPARRLALDAVIVVGVVVVGLFQTMYHPIAVPPAADLQTFPRSVAEWRVDSRPDTSTIRFPALDDELVRAYPSPSGERHFVDMDDELVRVYRNAAGQSLHLYVGYYRDQREGKELIAEAGHALNAAATTLRVPLAEGTVEVGQVVQQLPRSSRGVLYWYDFNGRTVQSIYRAKQYLAWDSLTRRRNNGAVVMIGWESSDGSDPERARIEAVAFARSILALLPRFIPS